MAGAIFWCTDWPSISRALREKHTATMRIDELDRLPKIKGCELCVVLTVSVHDLDKDQDDGELHCRQAVLHFSRERGAFFEEAGPYRRKAEFVAEITDWLTTTEAALRLGAA